MASWSCHSRHALLKNALLRAACDILCQGEGREGEGGGGRGEREREREREGGGREGRERGREGGEGGRRERRGERAAYSFPCSLHHAHTIQLSYVSKFNISKVAI